MSNILKGSPTDELILSTSIHPFIYPSMHGPNAKQDARAVKHTQTWLLPHNNPLLG